MTWYIIILCGTFLRVDKRWTSPAWDVPKKAPLPRTRHANCSPAGVSTDPTRLGFRGGNHGKSTKNISELFFFGVQLTDSLIHDCLRSLGRTSLMKGFLAITDSESKACAMFSNPSSIKALTVRVEWRIQSCWRWMVCWYSSSWTKKSVGWWYVDDYRESMGVIMLFYPLYWGLAQSTYARSLWAWSCWRPGILGQRWKFATGLLRQDVRVGSQVFGRNFVIGDEVAETTLKSQQKKAKK